jgi:hypothetical protein
MSVGGGGLVAGRGELVVGPVAAKWFGITCKFQKEEEKVKSKIIKIIKINKIK